MNVTQPGEMMAPEMRFLSARVIDGATRQHGKLWALLSMIFIAVVLIFECVTNVSEYTVYTRFLACLVTVLSCLPWLRYCLLARFNDYPFFEFHCLFNALCYGYAGFRPVTDRSALTGEMLQTGLLGSSLSIAGLYVGYYAIAAIFRGSIRPFQSNIRDTPLNCALGMVWSLFLLFVIFGCQLVGITAMNQVYKFVLFFGITLWGTYCFSSMARTVWRVVFVVALSIPIGLAFLAEGSIGYIIGASTPICVVYMWSRKRIILWPLVIIFAFIILFQPVKNTYRSIVLHEGMKSEEQVQVMRELLQGQHDYRTTVGSSREQFERSFLRMNHLTTLAMVMRDTPSLEPFEKGASYWPIFVKWIPRALWANKPVEDYGNKWPRRYGYIDQHDFVTSFNLPWLTEYYMNFGWFGMALIPILVGILFRLLLLKLGVNRLAIYDFAFGYPILMAIGGGESNFSMVFGGVVVGGICMWVTVYPFLVWLRRTQNKVKAR